MSCQTAQSHRSGFTLIELLTVVAVIGILAAVLIPTVGSVRKNAQRSAAASNLRQVAIAYSAYANGGGRPRSIQAETIYDWARVLAEQGHLNDPEIYILDEDPLVEQTEAARPLTVAFPPAEGNTWTLDPDFDGFPLSFVVASGIASQAPPSTTPIAWTRGLQSSGTWAPLDAENPGVYGAEGGHIVFLDGHVTFYRDLAEGGGQLLNYTTRRPTANIADALSPGAEALDHTGSAF